MNGADMHARAPVLAFTLVDIEDDPLAAIRAAQAAVPILTSEGWGHDGLAGKHAPGYPKVARDLMLAPWWVGQFVRAAQWLDRVPPQTAINRKVSSYAWKHVAERWHERRSSIGRGYVSNGMFLAAALAMGRRIEPIQRSPNAYVAIPDRAARMP